MTQNCHIAICNSRELPVGLHDVLVAMWLTVDEVSVYNKLMVLGHYQVQLLWKLYVVPVSGVKDDYTNITINGSLFVLPVHLEITNH